MSVFHMGVQAQTVSVKENTKASITTKSYDDCSSILEVTISPSDEYYFDFCITENNIKLTSSEVSLEGDASVFKFNEHNNIKWGDQGSYNGKTTTFYLNTRKGKPYIFSSVAPSLTDVYMGIKGEETINDGDKVEFEGVICPPSSGYSFQWYENNVAIAGETSANLSYEPTSPTATFRLEASENGSLVKSATKTIQTLASTDKYTITPWWGVGSHNIKEVVGHCGSVYLVNLSISDNEPQFAIKIDKNAIDEIDNGTSLSISKMSGGDGTPGWKITNSGIAGKKVTFYIDARTTPVKLTNSIEEREFIVASISQTKGSTAVERGELVSFVADACKNSSSEVSFQWQSSTDGGSTWENIEGGNTSSLEDFSVTTDKTKIRVVASNGTVTSHSIPVTLAFEPSRISVEIENAQKINSTEYEVLNHESVKMTVLAERMSDAVLKVKVKDFSSSTWRDTTLGSGSVWTFEPSQNLVYRIQATGTLNNTDEQGTITKEFILRIIHRCDENAATDTLWHDDFGRFADANTYITKDADGAEQEHSGSITDENSNDCPISNYMSADPNFFVKRHDFAALDPLFGPYTEDCGSDGYKHYACWEDCNGIRVEDGYYAILTNPNTSNCGRSDRDYWDGTDHSGNKNGGMLFVNCSDNSKNTIIYERDLTLSNECENVQLLFSAYISNAAIKVGQKPVNVRLDVLDEDKKLIHSVASGDIMPRTSGEKWTNMTFRFKSTGQRKYTIQLTNNNEGGAENYGNDILLDDISITICYPNVSLITDLSDKVKDTVETCQLDTVVNLYAYNENGIKNYIDEPVYLFQYKKGNLPDAKWQDIETGKDGLHISSEDNIQIELSKDDPRFFGTTNFRSIVASSADILNDVIQEENETGKISMTVDCDHVYAIDSAFVIVFDYNGPMGTDIDTAGCIGEAMNIIGDAAEKPSYKWMDADADTLISENEKELNFVIDGRKEIYNFYFIGIERLGCTDTQKVVVRKKDLVWFDAPEEFVICEYDSAVTLTDIVLNKANENQKPTFAWSLNGEADATQTGSTFKIPSGAPLTGTIVVTGSADGFCDSTRTIKYTIHKEYELSLDTDVDDDHLCFNNLNNTITLTAKVTPEVAMPSKFYWFSKKELVGESDGPSFNLTIEENGIYDFVVKSIDNVCYKDSANAPAAIDTIWASRTADMKLVTTPENAIICEGESIKFALEIENALVEKAVNWKSDDIDTTSVTEGFKSDITITPTKTSKFTDKREMEISVFDDVCNKPIEVKAPYEVHNKMELGIDEIETFCLTAGEKITLNATVSAGEPKKYVWLEGETRLDSTATNTASILISEGKNNYSVIAIDSVCESKASAVMTTEARLPITIDITPKDTVFCEGTTVTFTANVTNALDSINVPVIWSSIDLEGDSTLSGKNCALSITPLKKDKLTETRAITISTADKVCKEGEPVSVTTNYTIHNKMEIAILAERTDGLFCLTSNDGEDVIDLKVDVTAGEPTQFTWYRNDAKIGAATKADTAVAISEGTNQYKVIASDGVCEEKESVVASIKARQRLGLDLNPKDADICEGESIKLTATLTDALNEDITILWEGDDIATGSKTIGNPASYTAKTTKKGNTMQTASATIKAHDDVCQRDTVVSVNYNVYMKIDIDLLSDIAGSKICLTEGGSNTANMTIKVKRGNPSQFIWNDGTVGSGKDTLRKVQLAEGTNTFSVRAMDEVCNKKDASEANANNSIETREPVKVDLFLDRSLVCIGNKIKATAAIKNSHAGSSSTITWSNNSTKNNAANGEHSQNFKPSVGTQSISVSVVDSKSDICPATTATSLISAQDSLYLHISPEQLTLCQREDTAQYIKLTVGITSGWPSSVVWSTGEKTTIDPTTKTTSIKVAPKKNTTYWAYGNDEVCKNSDKIYTKEIKVSNKLKVDVELEKSEYQMGEEVTLVAHTSNDEYETIKWVNTETGEVLGETEDKRFSFQLDEEAYGVFKYGVIVDNIYCGEIESGKRKITVADYTPIPNIITPYNDNGKNDVFMGPKDGKPGYKVEIYNRYQQLIYEGEEGWDGVYRGYLAEPGTYFYRIFMKDGKIFKGTLEVAKF